MDELEQALSVTGLTNDDDSHVMINDDVDDGDSHNVMISDSDKKLIQHAVELIKVAQSHVVKVM